MDVASVKSRRGSSPFNVEAWPADVLTLWQKAVCPDEPYKLERRLQWDRIDPKAALGWVDQSDSTHIGLHPSIPQPWHPWLCKLQQVLVENWDQPLLPYGSEPKIPFIDLWQPLLPWAKELLNQSIRGINPTPVIAASALDCLASNLIRRIGGITEPVLWEEFQESSSPASMLLAHLGSQGDGKSQPLRKRYQAFIEQHRRDGLHGLLGSYPVLARLLGTAIHLWQQSNVTMLRRICGDRNELADHFGVPTDAVLTGIQQGLSDPHCGGQAVAILAFAVLTHGIQTKTVHVVYKPKEMGVDVAYQAAIASLNAISILPPLRTLGVIQGEGYGYMEYLPHQLCSNPTELKQFYQNAGRLTAVLHVLGCTDCHHENLIANRSQLVLIDTETLLEAPLPDYLTESSTHTNIRPTSQLREQFQSSVLRSGLLPQWIFVGVGKLAIDTSALGITPPLQPQMQRPGWLGINSDGMLPGSISCAADLPTSLPVGIGSSNPFSTHLEEFCEGFLQQMETLLSVRSKWLARGGMLDQFAGLPRRIVFRATRVYSAIQQQQLEPTALRSSFNQAMKLEQLARSFLLSEKKPPHWPIFLAEVQQMDLLDIPFFTHLIDGNAIQLGGGMPDITGIIKMSGLEAARQRLANLDSSVIDFQLRLIRGAVEARQLNSSPGNHLATSGRKEAQSTSMIKEVTAAIRIADQLLCQAIIDENRNVEWIGMDLGSDSESFVFGPVGTSLYGGSIGIACLIHQLRKAGAELSSTPAPKVLSAEDVVDAILLPLRQLAHRSSSDLLLRWWRDQPLGLAGCGGIILSLQELGEAELATQLIRGLTDGFVSSDNQLDVIGGCSGLIGSLIRLGTESSLVLARAAGVHLVNSQREDGSWSKGTKQQPGLLGFSHGTAGHAAALSQLHASTGIGEFRTAAINALSYERRFFDLEKGNWPDFRRNTTGVMTSWCHGAPGIALGRACLWGTVLWDEQASDELNAGLRTTATTSVQSGDHLCCGSLGLVALMRVLLQGPWTISADVRRDCVNAISSTLYSILRRCGLSRPDLRCFTTAHESITLPGFFNGLSGMAMALINTSASNACLGELLSAGLLPCCSLSTQELQADHIKQSLTHKKYNNQV